MPESAAELIANTDPAPPEVLAVPLPTLNPETANTDRVIPEVLASPAAVPEVLAGRELEEVSIDESFEFSNPVRLEPRFNPQTGKLRGIAWRERTKERKGVYYVGAKSKGRRKEQFDELRPVFAGKRRGRKNDPGTSVGSGLDGLVSVGTG